MTSLGNLEYWLETIKKCNSDNIVIYVIGNKSDCKQKVHDEMLNEFKINHNIKTSFKVSAKDNSNIKDMFKSFYTDIYKTQKEYKQKKHEQLRHKQNERKLILKKNKEGCC